MSDDCWEEIDGLTFYPWKGPNYESSILGIRILVMGESTHLSEAERLQHKEALEQEGSAWFAKEIM